MHPFENFNLNPQNIRQHGREAVSREPGRSGLSRRSKHGTAPLETRDHAGVRD